MLMKRARAYSSFFSQVILVYLHPFCRNSLFCRRKLQKITKNPYLGFKVINFNTIKSMTLVLVTISNMSVSICNRFHDRQANSGRGLL